jgi:hypothetical protein
MLTTKGTNILSFSVTQYFCIGLWLYRAINVRNTDRNFKINFIFWPDITDNNTAPQAGRSRLRFPMVSLEFFSDIILPVALWRWGRLSLWQKWVPEILPGGKDGRCVRLTTLAPFCADCLEIQEPQPPGTPRARPGLLRESFTFITHSKREVWSVLRMQPVA